jgi:glycosyltransferase involved in cell wall biosynthesis
MRLLNLVKYLSKQHKITLLALIDEKEAKTWIAQSNQTVATDLSRCQVELVPVRCIRGKWRKVIRILSPFRWRLLVSRLLKIIAGTPPWVAAFYRPEMAKQLKRLLVEENFDLIHFDYTQMGCYLPIAQWSKATKVLVEVEIAQVSHRRSLLTLSGWWRMWAWLSYVWTSWYEKRLWRRFDGVIAVSDTDRDYILAREPEAKVEVVPNGVEPTKVRRKRFKKESFAQLLFVGGTNHFPNVDGLHYFLKEIWPKVKNKLPQATLTVVGQGWESLSWTSKDGVTLTGYVEDLSPYFEATTLLVAPIRIGGGTRLKILEAMAASVPVVTTSIGGEGIGFTAGKEALVADDPDGFTQSIVELATNQELAQAIGNRARRFVKTYYLWSDIAQQLVKAYQIFTSMKGS